MKKGPVQIIVLALLVIMMILSIGTVNVKGNERVLLDFRNKDKIIYVTPDGSLDGFSILDAIETKGAVLESFTKDGKKDEEFLIYVNEDYGKNIEVKIKNLWGVKTYKVVLILSNHIKFYVDDDVVAVLKKDDVVANAGLPEGDYEWFVNKDLTIPFDYEYINSVLSLYAQS